MLICLPRLSAAVARQNRLAARLMEW